MEGRKDEPDIKTMAGVLGQSCYCYCLVRVEGVTLSPRHGQNEGDVEVLSELRL